MSNPLPAISGPLLAWYAVNARPLPWREDVSPYRVWISEIMLQQTRIEAARGYFTRFLAAFPDVTDLAAAPEDAVLKQWEGLGYYSRARNLHKAAKILCETYGGELPADYAALRALPGIGDYTAGAIASIAFGLPEPAVDGNVLRICTRLTVCDEDIGKDTVKKYFREQLREQYAAITAPCHCEGAPATVAIRTPSGNPDRDTYHCGAFSSALMELGETVCLPGTPDCDACPLAPYCAAHAAGNETEFPHMPAKKPRRLEEKTVFVLRCGTRQALNRRPDKGLLAGLWELPNRPGRMDVETALHWAEEHGLEPAEIRPLGEAVHIFSHVEWHMTGIEILCAAENPAFTWTEDIRQYAIPTAFRAYTKEK